MNRGIRDVRGPSVALLLALVGFSLFLFAASAKAAFPGRNGKVVFYTDRDGNNEIYDVNPDATGLTRLTNNTASDTDPAWSPDGSKVVFVSNRDGNNELYTMDSAGGNQTRLTNNTAFDADPTWSPDGTQIAFASDRDGNFEIYTMNAAPNSPATRLTNNAAHDGFPAWSPDGFTIAFESARDGNDEVYTMNADGIGPVNRTNNAASDNRPSWSPDGTQIAFRSTRTGHGGGDIWKFNFDGSGSPTDLSASNAVEDVPAWSPDGTRVAETYTAGGATELAVLPPFSSTIDLAPAGKIDSTPDWQPLRAYARPKGATPIRVALTPAYKQCLAPNATHPAPYSFGECVPPQPESSYLTVGTLNFNGQAANSVGSVRIDAFTGASESLKITVTFTDVRCQSGSSGGCSGGALSDYTGDLRFDTKFRITDLANGGGTLLDVGSGFSVPCATTASTTLGSTCSLTMFSGSEVVPGQRAIWQLAGDIKLYDGGLDGDPNTGGDNTLFAVGGVFLP